MCALSNARERVAVFPGGGTHSLFELGVPHMSRRCYIWLRVKIGRV
jgi:hypothetical protein